MFAPVAATGPSTIVRNTLALAQYNGIGAPRRFDVAKSMRAPWARPARVITEVGNRLARPASPPAPPVRSARSRAS